MCMLSHRLLQGRAQGGIAGRPRLLGPIRSQNLVKIKDPEPSLPEATNPCAAGLYTQWSSHGRDEHSKKMLLEMTLLDEGIEASARHTSLPMTNTKLTNGRLMHLPSARLVFEADQKIRMGKEYPCGLDPLPVRNALREL